MDNKITFDTIMSSHGYKGKKFSALLTENNVDNKKLVFSLIKDGCMFSEEVLEKVGIKKVVRNEKLFDEIVKHEKEEHKTYQKDTKKLDKILDELNNFDVVLD